MERKIGNVIIDDACYHSEDLYSDGDAVEEALLMIAKNCREEELEAEIVRQKSWPVLYHFSKIRQNILDWYPFEGTEKVLEIGSGCGAITGLLAKKAKSVECVELSQRRSEINAYRNRVHDNIRIRLGNFQEVEKTLPRDYDVITLIGVFEYASLYIQDAYPQREFLKTIASHLAPNGKIIIAIENRMGLKYWAGCTEDHTGHYFEGIEGYYQKDGVRTFSKGELERIFDDADLKERRFYYPYPDYKFPMTIFSDDYLPHKGELNMNMNNFDRPRMVLFDESKVFDTLLENGLFPLYSNSYLVVLKGAKQ